MNASRMKSAMLALLIVLTVAASAFAAAPTVKFTVTGNPVPGGTAAVRAEVTITDGSTLQSIKWTQVAGAKATLSAVTSDTVTVFLPDRAAYKHELVALMKEPPIKESDYPVNIPRREFFGGLQDRWVVTGIVPRIHEEAAAIVLNAEIVTTSGTYNSKATVETHLPWPMAAGLTNVPVGNGVLLHGKTQDTYDWTLTVPTGSNAKLVDAKTQNPDFVPDVAGVYTLKVTELATQKPITMTINAGTWRGMVVGIDADKNPIVAQECKTCHVGLIEKFGPWAKSGHAEIFIQNVNTPGGHYSEACVSCHTVGYDKSVANGGIDDASDWGAFMQTDLLTHADPLNFSKIVQQFPNTAKLSGIQCENCHGPQNSEAHGKWAGARVTLSSDMCGTCHGEPARHGRFQQWQLSAHANYELAGEEAMNASCAKCHSGNGFLAWAATGYSDAALKITWTKDEVHPITCVICHDPHDVGTTSGNAATNATVRVSGKTPALPAGFTATNVGRGAICMMCHNARRGLRDDAHFSVADSTRAPHVGPQADVLMGQNMYFTTVGNRGYHSMIEDSCVTCHMESTPPPADLSYKLGGTNHTFFASKTICAKCHTNITVESVQKPVLEKMHALQAQIELAIKNLMQSQIRAGNKIDLGGKIVTTAADIKTVEFIESHGRQGVTVTLADGTKVVDLSLQSVKVVRPAGAAVDLYSLADPALPKAGWNLFVAESDKSLGVHNPGFVNAGLDVALFAVKALNASASMPSGGGFINAALGGGLGNGAGAVSCTTPYVYWVEIAGHMPGNAGSQWRTDIVARNLSTKPAALRFFLHQTTGNLQGDGTIVASGQKAFEDIVATLGGNNNLGSLEVCSDQPLLMTGRIFNQGPAGTFGQNIDGQVADLGYSTGQTISLIGMRQKSDAFRTNLSVTNAGTTEAQVAITLFDSTGKSLTTYNLTVPAGAVVQDVEPFKGRANLPDVDWGFATVTVLKGTNIRSFASMIDMKTNDPTTIPAKQ